MKHFRDFGEAVFDGKVRVVLGVFFHDVLPDFWGDFLKLAKGGWNFKILLRGAKL